MNSNYLIGQFSAIAIVAFLVTLGIAKMAKWQKTGDLFYQRDKRFWSTFVLVIIVWTGAGMFIMNNSILPGTISKSAAAEQLLNDEQRLAKSWNSHNTANQLTEKLKNSKKEFEVFGNTLLNQSWPSYAKKDIDSLFMSISTVTSDLEVLITSASTLSTSEKSQFSKDIYSFFYKLKIVEHDLGMKVK